MKLNYIEIICVTNFYTAELFCRKNKKKMKRKYFLSSATLKKKMGSQNLLKNTQS